MDKIGLIFLGDASIDGRCMNMLITITNAGRNAVLIHTGSQNLDIPQNIEVISIDLLNKDSGISKYYTFHTQVKKNLNQLQLSSIIAGDIFSLPAIAMQPNHIRKIFDSRELYSRHGGLKNKPLKQFFWSTLEKFYIKKADIILVTAEMDRNYLIERYGKLNVEIIFNYPSSKPLNENKYLLREKLGISNECKIFLYQGVIHNHRGIRKMIDLLKHFENTTAVIIGSGPAKNEIESYAAEMGVKDHVYFTGSIPYSELFNYTQSADIGFSIIQPITESYKQALPNKIFEYGYCGVPVIASNFPEMEKFIHKYKLGETVHPGKEEEHILAVEKILSVDKTYSEKNEALTWESQSSKFLKAVGFSG